MGTVDFANRMADYGIDPWWMSHEPWIVAEPFTPEAGELWSKEDIDLWIDVVAKIAEEARENPELVKTAPHNQPIAQVKGEAFEDPALWAMTWRAWMRKQAGEAANAARPERRGRAGLSRRGPRYRGAGSSAAGPAPDRPRCAPVIGPALKPTQGKRREDEAGAARRLADDRAPVGGAVDQAVQLRTARTPRHRRDDACRHDHVAGEVAGSVASVPPSRTRAGQPPPMMQPPLAACLSESFPAADRRDAGSGARRVR